ncbi:LPS export ABC transporter periplasmic protein LptC [Prevotella sp. E13-27]|uniref:LPS export ABC transporter periplasmic protein LptC n=1 Tax=Prevotella sp. E13-27 TaxID=2938122 RepID=UPI00293E4B89|nr:LPS export ABC transporter periplasmic protein LptC [Prevotella sp. E13-27]
MESRINVRFTLVSLVVAFHMLLVASCSDVKEHTADAINPEDSVAMMTSYGVNTLISDSGVIKYRIVAERWEVNTLRQPSRWEFMKGIFFEQFDEQFHIQAYVQADTAWYFDQLNLWKLRGRVNIRTSNDAVYTGEELYWDGRNHELYSNTYSRLVTPERTVEGTCFRSDEAMTRYTISNSKGSFVKDDIEDDEKASETSAEETAPDDTAAVVPVRQATQKRSKSGK